MSTMAMADTLIGEITPELLSGRLQYAFDNWLAGELPLLTGAITLEKAAQFQAYRETAVGEFYANEDNGYAHSLAVYNRLKEIAKQSPKMMQLVIGPHRYVNEPDERVFLQRVERVFTWAAMLHDLMRFFGFGTPDHEIPAVKLARAAFGQEVELPDWLANAMIRHDYFCPIADGEEVPMLFLESSLAEMFRLADKTSLPPADEVDRWRKYGRRYGTKFYNRDLPDDVRFDLPHNYEQRDQVTYLLMLFAVQPSDFYAHEAAEIYRRWALGKAEALRRIMAIAREERVSERAVMDIIQRFHRHYGLPMPEGSEYLRVYS